MSKYNAVGQVTHILFVSLIYIFLWLPLIVLLIFSFNAESFPSPWQGFTLKWYKELANSVYLWKAFMNSLIISLTSTFLSVLMSIGLIFYVTQGGKIGKYINLFYGSIFVPETALGVSLLGFFGLIGVPLGLTTLIVSHTILGLGFVIPIVYARFLELDSRLTEASLVLGATPFQTFFKITLPLLRPALMMSGLLVFILSFDDFILTFFCSGSSVQTLSMYILSMIRSGVSPIINAFSVILLFMSSLIALVYFQLNLRSKIFL